MALVTVQRSPSPSGSAETDELDELDTTDSNVRSPRQRRRSSRAALKKLRKLFNTVRFVSKLTPCFSESYFTVKGAALILPQSDETVYTRRNSRSHAGDDIQSHLQAMFSLLRPSDTIKVAVKLEGTHTRYLVVVACCGCHDTEESVLLGIDILERASIGLIMPVWAHTEIELDGDGGFSIKCDKNVHTFKPVSVQAMWSALQSLNKVVRVAKDKLYIPRGLTHTWVGYYEARVCKEAYLIAEWNATADRDISYRTDKRMLAENAGEEDIYKAIRHELKNIMMTVDLEDVTCIFLRKSIEKVMGRDLKGYKSFIDTQMMEILGQMDAPSRILDYLYLGSEWNASNLEELQHNGVQHILNISREIDNFFPGILYYMNVREWDVDESPLMKYWESTHSFINKARDHGGKTLVHCKMGISRSASTVIAYLMKEKKWSLKEAFDYTKSKRSIVNPNNGFMEQLEMYQGILNANWNRERVWERHGNEKSLPKQVADADDIPAVDCYQQPEDFLAMKLGPVEGLQDPFLHTENDIEIASRSADSTEDSLDQLSPEGIQSADKFKQFTSDKDKGDSSDGMSSDSFNETDSENLSFDEGEDLEGGNSSYIGADGRPELFIPINPAIRVETRQMKGNNRRCKSEGDKALLNLPENASAFSREGSVLKFKPDGSWIKPPSEDNMVNNEDIGDGNEKILGTVEKEPIPDADTIEGLWMDDSHIPKWDVSENKPDMESVGLQQARQVDLKVEGTLPSPYSKENISWYQGTVLKQKQDIEEKYGAAGKEVALKEKTNENTQESVNTAVCALEVKDDEKKVEKDIIGDQSHRNEATEVCKIAGNTEIETRMSVYEAEDIEFPEGIVRKTKLEIEEKHRLSLETPRTRLKRSSSLKSKRVTPKSKDRENERRKTCIAMLSPTHPDNTDTEWLSPRGNDTSGLLTPDICTSPLWTAGKPVSVSQSEVSATGSEPVHIRQGEVPSPTGSESVKVYKFMGEELTVQEGLVKKQTLDIESKSNDIHFRNPTKSESSPGRNKSLLKSESVPNFQLTKPSTNQKQTECNPSNRSSPDTIRKTIPETPVISAETLETPGVTSTAITKTLIAKRDSTSGLQSISSSPPRSLFPLEAKQSAFSPKSCFDPQTLKLIREIGSALLNSPAKTEMVEDKDVDLVAGESLVHHYVRKIEGSLNVGRKSARREIIIIDKDESNSDAKKYQPFSPAISSGSKSELDVKASSKWSPVAIKQSASSMSSETNVGINGSANNRNQSTSSAKENLVSSCDSTPKVSDTKLNKADLDLNLKTNASVTPAFTEEGIKPTDTCSVKNLVGKFEQPPEQISGKTTLVTGTVTVLSPSVVIPILPVTKPDIQTTNSVSQSAVTTPSPEDGHKLLHRHSEPVIHLSDSSLFKMFEAKLLNKGELDTFTVQEEGESGDNSNASDFSSQHSGTRPKSASDSCKRGHRSLGSATGRGFLEKSRSLTESAGKEPDSQFTWGGKKVRKSYGKSHPLAKLENVARQSMEIRNNPFYSSM
ncbi:uncharacterized protein LOC127872888 isoform X3 [Dreissena polymorpha]|uniref:uncharacterized protein LOC127872888 isoform X3 n=1 Tax=Dreissena polymorpha TaxID=45954 RepID=UPI0022655A24|nr:uncharacterized protein LOC127872888 isoform X3 [Dreissena polymorpha]